MPRAYIVQIEGKVVASHAPRKPHPPGSLAKLAAALVVVEADARTPGLLDGPVLVSGRAASAGGTRLGLRGGDRVRARDLLAAMLVGSSNDACLALAEHVGGNVATFVDRMNATAHRLGMKATRFADPCGFDRPGQQTTAEDMLALAVAALRDPLVVALSEERTVRVYTVGKRRAFVVKNTNALLGRYHGAFGLKTGYTAEAGPCLIAAVRQGGTIAIVVLLGAKKDRWRLAVVLLDEAFDRVMDMPRVRDRATTGEPDP